MAPHTLQPSLVNGANNWVKIEWHVVGGRFAEKGRIGENRCCPSYTASNLDPGAGDVMVQ